MLFWMGPTKVSGSGHPHHDNQPTVASPTQFLNSLQDWVDNGGGVLPLTGAGISIAAGFPVLTQLMPYLQDCVVRSVWPAIPKKLRKKVQATAWNPHVDPWPEFDQPADQSDNQDQRRRCLETAIRLDVRARLRGRSQCKGAWILQEAYGAMADWQTALDFLARLREPEEKTDENDHARESTSEDEDGDGDEDDVEEETNQPKLGAKNEWVIDALFQHVGAFKQPVLTHRMFSALSDTLRIRVTMTTNFDDLYEQAYEEQERTLKVFDVHQDAPLPSGHAVLAERRSLVKLHGGRYGFRADSTLYDQPTSDDRRRFTSYVLGKAISADEWERLLTSEDAERRYLLDEGTPRVFLVAGVSASDPRILRLLESAASVVPDSTKPLVYWIAYSRKDIENLLDELEKYPNLRRRMMLTQQRELGVFLLQLYQQIAKTIPRGGLESAANWRQPAPPWPAGMETHPFGDSSKQPYHDHAEALARDIERLRKLPAGDMRHRMLRMINPPKEKTFDGVSAASVAFDRQLDEHVKCVWLELDEIHGIDDFFERMLQAMGKLVGKPRWIPGRASQNQRIRGVPVDGVKPGDLLDNRIEEVSRLVGRDYKNWVIFVHALELPTKPIGMQVNWDTEACRQLATLLERLSSIGTTPTGTRLPGVTLVTLEEEASLLTKEVDKQITDAQRPPTPKGIETVLDWMSRHHPGLGPIKPTLDAILWKPSTVYISRADRQFLRSLHAYTLAEMPRHLVALGLWSMRRGDALERFDLRAKPRPDTDASAAWQTEAAERVETLHKSQWARGKSGGFVWMHSPVKRLLRRRIESLLENDAKSRITFERVIDVHQSLADWQLKLFIASGDPPALFESIKHRLYAAGHLLRTRQDDESDAHDPKAFDPRLRLLSSICEIEQILQLGRDSLLSRGHTAGSCTRIEKLIPALEKLDEDVQREFGQLNAHLRKFQAVKNTLPDGPILSRHYTALVTIRIRKAIATAANLQYRLALEVSDSLKTFRRLDNAHNELTAFHNTKPKPKETKGDKTRETNLRLVFDGAVTASSARAYAESAELLKCVVKHVTCPKGKHHGDRPPFIRKPKQLDRKDLVVRTRQIGAIWGAELQSDPVGLDILIRSFRRFTQLDLFRAEAATLAELHELNVPTTDEFDEVSLLKRAALSYHLASELTRFYQGSTRRLLRERVRLKSHFGLVLAVAGEHAEARQRFNEATAISSMLTGDGHALQNEVIGIHHTDGILLRVRNEIPSIHNRWVAARAIYVERRRPDATRQIQLRIKEDPGPDRQKAMGLLQDADAMLEVVRERAMEKRKNTWWLCRFLYLRILTESLRCMTLLDASPRFHPRLTRSRGGGLGPSTVRIRQTLETLRHVVRTDRFILLRATATATMTLNAMLIELQTYWASKGALRQRHVGECMQLRDEVRRAIITAKELPQLPEEVVIAKDAQEWLIPTPQGEKKQSPNEVSLDPQIDAYCQYVLHRTPEILSALPSV